jgi:hypothetical protein
MKLNHILLLLIIPLIAAQCKKEEKPDYPCVGQQMFYCKINGKPFKAQGQFPCAATNNWYDPVTGNLSIAGTDCMARDAGEPRLVTFYMFGMQRVNILEILCRFVMILP